MSGGPGGGGDPHPARGARTAHPRLAGRLLGSLIATLGPGTRELGASWPVPRGSRGGLCRPGLGYRRRRGAGGQVTGAGPCQPLSPDVKGQRWAGAAKSPGFQALSGPNQLMRNKGELVRPLKGEGKERMDDLWHNWSEFPFWSHCFYLELENRVGRCQLLGNLHIYPIWLSYSSISFKN